MPNILVVEDDQQWQEGLSKALRSLINGGFVDIAPTYEEALYHVKETPYDLITVDLGLAVNVTDLQRTDLIGVELLQAVRKSQINKEAGLVVVTGRAGKSNSALEKLLLDNNVYDLVEKNKFNRRKFEQVALGAIQKSQQDRAKTDDVAIPKTELPKNVNQAESTEYLVKTGLASEKNASISISPNFPPQDDKFFGREKDVARVLEILDSRVPHITIHGMGGVGKSSLAVEVAHHSLPGPNPSLRQPFESVVWISAKDQPEQKRWQDEVLDTVSKVENDPTITQMPSEQKPSEIDRLLRTHRTLIILDNFDTIKDPTLIDWIYHIPEPSKVLITTRKDQIPGTWDIHLGGFETSEGLEFIRSYAQHLGLNSLDRASKETLLTLVQSTKGHPLALKIALENINQNALNARPSASSKDLLCETAPTDESKYWFPSYFRDQYNNK